MENFGSIGELINNLKGANPARRTSIQLGSCWAPLEPITRTECEQLSSAVKKYIFSSIDLTELTLTRTLIKILSDADFLLLNINGVEISPQNHELFGLLLQKAQEKVQFGQIKNFVRYISLLKAVKNSGLSVIWDHDFSSHLKTTLIGSNLTELRIIGITRLQIQINKRFLSRALQYADSLKILEVENIPAFAWPFHSESQDMINLQKITPVQANILFGTTFQNSVRFSICCVLSCPTLKVEQKWMLQRLVNSGIVCFSLSAGGITHFRNIPVLPAQTICKRIMGSYI